MGSAAILGTYQRIFVGFVEAASLVVVKLFRKSKKPSDRHAEHVAHQARARGILLASLNGPDGPSEMPLSLLNAQNARHDGHLVFLTF